MRPFWLVLALLAALAVATRVIMHRRRFVADLTALARRRRLNFSAIDLIGIHERYYSLDLIRQGHACYAWNVLYGSMDAGLVALFQYHYDVGFGVHQSSRQWWMVVVETSYLHDPWQARPVTRSPSDGMSENGLATMHIGPFRIRADHAAALDQLSEPAVKELIAAAPQGYHWEARGPLLAVCTPADRDPQTPGHLLTSACELARRLKPPSP